MPPSNGPGRKPRVTNEEILEAIMSADDPVLTAPEIADALPINRRAVHNRLEALIQEGRLRRKKIGGQFYVYWTTGT